MAGIAFVPTAAGLPCHRAGRMALRAVGRDERLGAASGPVARDMAIAPRT
jgi:hypothetical protein